MTITIAEAISRLRSERAHVAATSPIWAETLDMAIEALEAKPKVAPARSTDPATSHEAAASLAIGADSARGKILLTAHHSVLPRTARELTLAAGLRQQRSPWKRVSELVQAGYLAPVDRYKDPATGRWATTYRITRKGVARAQEIKQERPGD